MLVYGVVIGIFFLVAIILSIPKRQEDPLKESVELPRSDRSKSLPDRVSQYRRLLTRVLGDNQAADRLIEYERQHSPSATESELIRKAIDRLEYDRGH